MSELLAGESEIVQLNARKGKCEVVHGEKLGVLIRSTPSRALML